MKTAKETAYQVVFPSKRKLLCTQIVLPKVWAKINDGFSMKTKEIKMQGFKEAKGRHLNIIGNQRVFRKSGQNLSKKHVNVFMLYSKSIITCWWSCH